MSNLHPLFQQIAQMHGAPAPMTAAELERHHEAIDAAMMADKLIDGYGKRNEKQAMDLQIKHEDANRFGGAA